MPKNILAFGLIEGLGLNDMIFKYKNDKKIKSGEIEQRPRIIKGSFHKMLSFVWFLVFIGSISCDRSLPVSYVRQSFLVNEQSVDSPEDLKRDLAKYRFEMLTRDTNSRHARISGLVVNYLAIANDVQVPFIEWDQNDYVEFVRVMRCFQFPSTGPAATTDGDILSGAEYSGGTVSGWMKNAGTSDFQAPTEQLGMSSYEDIYRQSWDAGFRDCYEVGNSYMGDSVQDPSAETGDYTYVVQGCFENQGCGPLATFSNFNYVRNLPLGTKELFQQRDQIFAELKGLARQIVEYDAIAEQEYARCDQLREDAFDEDFDRRMTGIFVEMGVNLTLGLITAMSIGDGKKNDGTTKTTGATSNQDNGIMDRIQNRLTNRAIGHFAGYGGDCGAPADNESFEAEQARMDCYIGNLTRASSLVKDYGLKKIDGIDLGFGLLGLGIDSLPMNNSRLGSVGIGGIGIAIQSFMIDEETAKNLRESCPLYDQATANRNRSIQLAEIKGYDLKQKINEINRLGEEGFIEESTQLEVMQFKANKEICEEQGMRYGYIQGMQKGCIPINSSNMNNAGDSTDGSSMSNEV